MNSAHGHLTIPPHAALETPERDEELVLAARAGSHAAFAELQQTYSRRLYRRILSITRNPEDAEDALQETFIRAYRGLPSFEGRAKFSSWLTRIAVNSALMTIRKRRARPEMSIDHLPASDEDRSHFDVWDSALNPEQAFDQKQRSQAILRAIERLDPKLRVSMGVWICQEHSMKDLAQLLGISIPSVKARLHRARKRLVRFAAPREQGAKLNRSQSC